MKEVSIAVVGATGAVGREFLKVLDQRQFPASYIKLLASRRSAGTRLRVKDQELMVEETTPDSFKGIDIAFISVNTQLSGELAPIAVEAGALVIDDSSYFRMRPEVPLVVPEVNGEDVEWHRGIISIPNCSTTPLVMLAHPLHRVNPIVRIIADTYQSVSGAGGAAIVELREQSRSLLYHPEQLTGSVDNPVFPEDSRSAPGKKGHPDPQALPHQIAFNIIPRIDSFLPDGYTREEQKMVDETRKIMHAPGISLSATCVRVPVYISHSAALHIEFERLMSTEEAREILGRMPGVKVLDAPVEGLYPMPWDVAGTDDVFVGRIRKDVSHPSGLAMWVVSDNLRKGAALNAIQIAEEVLRRDCLSPAKGFRPSTSASPGNQDEAQEDAVFEGDCAYYEANRQAFLKEYEGRYIAIINKTVVDSDTEFSPLAKRVYAKYMYKAILMTLVEAEPKVVHIRSPRLDSWPRR